MKTLSAMQLWPTFRDVSAHIRPQYVSSPLQKSWSSPSETTNDLSLQGAPLTEKWDVCDPVTSQLGAFPKTA